MSDPMLSAEVEAMVGKIAGDADPELIALARRIAEAEIDVMRVRRFRMDLLSREFSYLSNLRKARIKSKDFLRMLSRALSKKPQPDVLADLQSVDDGTTEVVPDFRREFAVIDRYERRALSRRKFAIRAFDEARAANRITTAVP